MPLPTPRDGETQDVFIARCMGDETMMVDFPEQDQRVAVCFSRWRETHGGEPPKQHDDPRLEAKILGPLEVLDEGKGEVSAVVATLEVVDKDKDIIPRNAFADGVGVKLSGYSHSAILGTMFRTGIPTEAPVGKGVIAVEGDRAVFRGKYFMSTTRGREAFATTKEMGGDQEWSIGYRILRVAEPSDEQKALGAKRILAEIAPLEVSPVMVGAGIGTHTVAVKCQDCGATDCGCAADKAAKESAEAEALAQQEAEAKAAAEHAELQRIMEDEFDRLSRNMAKFGA